MIWIKIDDSIPLAQTNELAKKAITGPVSPGWPSPVASEPAHAISTPRTCWGGPSFACSPAGIRPSSADGGPADRRE